MKSVSAGSREQVITGLSPNTRYYFKIRAVGPVGAGGYSRQVSIVTSASEGGAVITGLNVAVEGDGVRLMWRDSSSANIIGNIASLNWKFYTNNCYIMSNPSKL